MLSKSRKKFPPTTYQDFFSALYVLEACRGRWWCCAQIADLIGLERTSEQGGRGESEGLKGFGASFKIRKKRGVSFNIKGKKVRKTTREASAQMMTDEEICGALLE